MNAAVRAVGVPLLLSVAPLIGCSADQSHMSDPGPHGPQCPAIQTAAGAGFASDRTAALKKIAATPGLTEHEQFYIIDATGKSGFSSDRADVLVALARNPDLTARARAHMSEQVEYSGLFSSDRARVAEALAAPPGFQGDR